MIGQYALHYDIPFEQSLELVEKFDKYLARYSELFCVEEKSVKLVQ